MASISGPKCSDLQSISPKFSRLRRAENLRATRAGQLDYPPSIEHPRHFPRGRRLPGVRPGFGGGLARESVGGLVFRGFGLCGSCVCLVCPAPPGVFEPRVRISPIRGARFETGIHITKEVPGDEIMY